MSHTLFMSYTGMRSRMRALEVLTNNLANLNSPGFKKSTAFFSVLQANSNGELSPMAEAIHGPQVSTTTQTDFSQGTLLATGNPLDISLSGDGFFVVGTPEGFSYTRNGNFRINQDRQLVTSHGDPVLGGSNLGTEGKPIVIPQGEIHISESGQISVDGVIVGDLRIASFGQGSQLKPIGRSLFKAPDGVRETLPDSISISQGFLEQANVNVVESITEMISLMRSFEMMTQTARSFSKDIDERLINEVGRV